MQWLRKPQRSLNMKAMAGSKAEHLSSLSWSRFNTQQAQLIA